MKKPFHKKNNKEYSSIHYWLKKNFGCADKCENKNCENKSDSFQWTLLKGKKYERKRENFWKLCCSCHTKYDATPEKSEKMRKINLGRKKSKAEIEKLKQSLTGRKPTSLLQINITKWTQGKPVLKKKKGKFVSLYLSMSDAARENNISVSSLSWCLIKSKNKELVGYEWCFAKGKLLKEIASQKKALMKKYRKKPLENYDEMKADETSIITHHQLQIKELEKI